MKSQLIAAAVAFVIFGLLAAYGYTSESPKPPVPSVITAADAAPTPTPAPVPLVEVVSRPTVQLLLVYPNGQKQLLNPVSISPAPASPCVAYLLEDRTRGIYCGTFKLTIIPVKN